MRHQYLYKEKIVLSWKEGEFNLKKSMEIVIFLYDIVSIFYYVVYENLVYFYLT